MASSVNPLSPPTSLGRLILFKYICPCPAAFFSSLFCSLSGADDSVGERMLDRRGKLKAGRAVRKLKAFLNNAAGRSGCFARNYSSLDTRLYAPRPVLSRPRVLYACMPKINTPLSLPLGILVFASLLISFLQIAPPLVRRSLGLKRDCGGRGRRRSSSSSPPPSFCPSR